MRSGPPWPVACGRCAAPAGRRPALSSGSPCAYRSRSTRPSRPSESTSHRCMCGAPCTGTSGRSASPPCARSSTAPAACSRSANAGAAAAGSPGSAGSESQGAISISPSGPAGTASAGAASGSCSSTRTVGPGSASYASTAHGDPGGYTARTPGASGPPRGRDRRPRRRGTARPRRPPPARRSGPGGATARDPANGSCWHFTDLHLIAVRVRSARRRPPWTGAAGPGPPVPAGGPRSRPRPASGCRRPGPRTTGSAGSSPAPSRPRTG